LIGHGLIVTVKDIAALYVWIVAGRSPSETVMVAVSATEY